MARARKRYEDGKGRKTRPSGSPSDWRSGQRDSLTLALLGVPRLDRRSLSAAEWDLDHPERRPIREVLTQERRRDVEDGDARLGAPFRAAVMGVAVEDGADGVAVERLLQATGPE